MAAMTLSVEVQVIGLEETERLLEHWPDDLPDPTITYETVTIEKVVFIKVGVRV